MKSLGIRAVSALIAVTVIGLLYHFFENEGLRFLGLFAVVVGGYELVRILFHPEDSKLNRFSFYSFLICIFLLSVQHPHWSGAVFAFFSVCFCLISLLTHNKFDDLEALMSFQSKAILGFLYVGLLPAFAIGLLDLPHGTLWFLTLLVIVFAGDIGAYLSGMTFGRKKLMPLISPKKTVEGAMGGLLCSAIAGLVIRTWMPQVPLFHMLILSVAAAIAGQFGDLFESQMKRVADVKDSGRIMPGHGGVLDRLDGVLFASPIIYFGAMLIEHVT